MRALLLSHFFVRFAGGFALGAVALFGMQPGAVAKSLSAVVGTVTDAARAV